MDARERDKRLSYARNQFEIHKVLVFYWQAIALTSKNTPEQQENLAMGETIGFLLTDKERTDNALKTMKRHIDIMSEINDTIDELMSLDND